MLSVLASRLGLATLVLWPGMSTPEAGVAHKPLSSATRRLEISARALGLAPPSLSHGPLLGAISESSVRIWARAAGMAPATYSMAVEYGEAGEVTGTLSSSIQLLDAQDYTGTVEVSGLTPGTDYWFRIWLDGAEVVGSDGTFSTLPTAASSNLLRFGFGSCNDHLEMPYPLFATIAADDVDFLLHIGDIIYADRDPAATTRSEFEDRYKLNFLETNWAAMMRQTPTFMTWDDHEIENDWAGGQTGLYIPARGAFDEYVSGHNPEPRLPGQLYYSFQAGPVEFFVLDTRSFRNPGTATMLGATQKAELLGWLSSSQAIFKFIVSSVQFSDITQKSDLWFGYQTERAQIFDYIRDHGIRGVVLLTGDRHWSGFFRHEQVDPYFLYELTSSPFGAAVGEAPPPDSSTLALSDAGHSYIVVEVDTSAEPATLDIRIRNTAGMDLQQLTITEDDIVAAVIFGDGFESGDLSAWSSLP